MKIISKDQIKFACSAYAILGMYSCVNLSTIPIGFIKLLQGYYMLLVTEAEAVAKIGSISQRFQLLLNQPRLDHKIYKVNFVSYVPLFSSSSLSSTTSKENKYFEYSFTEPLTNSSSDICNI